jgi:hypothetical protein
MMIILIFIAIIICYYKDVIIKIYKQYKLNLPTDGYPLLGSFLHMIFNSQKGSLALKINVIVNKIKRTSLEDFPLFLKMPNIIFSVMQKTFIKWVFCMRVSPFLHSRKKLIRRFQKNTTENARLKSHIFWP